MSYLRNEKRENTKSNEDRKHMPESRAAGRARVAQLLGELLYRRWKKDEERQEKQKGSKSK